MGLNMHLGKTKVMLNKHTNKATVTINGKTVEEVAEYVYLGKTVTRDGDLMPAIKRCFALGWAILIREGKHHEIREVARQE